MKAYFIMNYLFVKGFTEKPYKSRSRKGYYRYINGRHKIIVPPKFESKQELAALLTKIAKIVKVPLRATSPDTHGIEMDILRYMPPNNVPFSYYMQPSVFEPVEEPKEIKRRLATSFKIRKYTVEIWYEGQ